jgi:hypothetical protein
MKRIVLVGALAGVLGAGVYAQGSQDAAKPAKKGAADAQGGGHAAPKPQPATEAAPSAPEGQVALGSVHLPKAVKADGKPLAAGTYQVRVTNDTASQEAKGQTKSLERWAEFMRGGKVVGREIVTIVPQADISKVQKDTPPKAGASKVEMLKGGDYVRVWINKGGNHYLMHLPV